MYPSYTIIHFSPPHVGHGDILPPPTLTIPLPSHVGHGCFCDILNIMFFVLNCILTPFVYLTTYYYVLLHLNNICLNKFRNLYLLHRFVFNYLNSKKFFINISFLKNLYFSFKYSFT